MSHFSKITTKLTRKSAIVKALKKLGLSDHMIEISDTPMALKNYYGKESGQKAHIRIKGQGWGHNQNYVGGSCTDTGFELLPDGTYALHIDQAKSTGWTRKLTQEYARATIQEIAEDQSYFIEDEHEEKGEIFIRLTSPF